MDPIYWAALLSFVAGACGYVIIRFWLLPIGRYRRSKAQLLKSFGELARSLPIEDAIAPKSSMGKRNIRDMRRVAVQLADMSRNDLPYWYRLVLMTRHESAATAAEKILRLENMPTSGQVRQCLREAALQLTTPKALTSIGL